VEELNLLHVDLDKKLDENVDDDVEINWAESGRVKLITKWLLMWKIDSHMQAHDLILVNVWLWE
jgi:hypothetical protein